LRWVPQFETGIPLVEDDVPEVINEMLALRSWADARSVDPSIRSRMDNFLQELRSLDWSSNIDVSVG
jgi:hypothetical protein